MWGGEVRFPIAQALREIREAEGLSQGELAKRLGLAQAVISQRETYTRPVRTEHLDDYARAFETDVPGLLERLAKQIRTIDARQKE